MRNLFLILAATLLVAACSPTEIELVEPEPTEQPGDTTQNTPDETNDFNNNKYWLLYKQGLYELHNTETNEFGQFRIDEAERLLRMPSTVWEIPEGAPYTFLMNVGLSFNKKLIK